MIDFQLDWLVYLVHPAEGSLVVGKSLEAFSIQLAKNEGENLKW